MNNYFSLRKRGLALFVALMMCLSLLPGTALAAEGECPENPGYPHYFLDGVCKYCSCRETKEPDKEDTYCTDGNHEFGEDGKCTLCGTSKYEPAEPGKPGEHVHSWTYTRDHWKRFTHVKKCACGETVSESCTTKVFYDPVYRQHMEKCTLCDWEDTFGGDHEKKVIKDNGNGSHTWYCDTCGEPIGEAEEHRFFNNQCECGAAEKPDEKPVVPNAPADGTDCGKCPKCGSGLTIKNGYVMCSVCPDFGGHPYETADERWCSQCSDYAQRRDCGGLVCYDGQKQVRHVLVKGAYCVDYNAHDHQCDICHAEMVERKWEVVEEPTCAADGLQVNKCTYAGCTLDAKPESKPIPTLGVQWGEWTDNGDGTRTRVCTYCNGKEDGHTETEGLTYTLTIHYQFVGGETIFPSVEKKLAKDEAYSVTSPALYGYAPEWSVVKGTMPAADRVVTVKYTAIPYTWTIVYVDKETGTELGTVRKTFTVDTVKELRDVESPDFEGYTTEQKRVAPPSSDKLEDKYDKVEYTAVEFEPARYTLTIHYQFVGGETAAESVERKLEAGKTYRVESPVLEGYTVERTVVEGTMQAADEVVTVKYTAIPYTWTINYVDEAGRQVAEPYTVEFTVETVGRLQPVASPAVEGYTTDTRSVAAPGELKDKVDTVVYRTVEQPGTYTVTWEDGYSANPVIKTATPNRGTGYEELYPADPTREGYTFAGWGEPVEDDGGNVTIRAQWTPVEEDDPTPPTPPVVTPTPTPAPAPATPAVPADPGVDISDEETPLRGTIGLDNTNHFAYIIGYGDGTVRPLANISQAEAVTIFFRLMTDEYRAANWSTVNGFNDVNAGSWFNNAISTCLKAGALEHFAQDASFLPNQAITRAEFASIAAGFVSDEYTGDTVGDFSDTEGHWAAEAIRKAVEAGWITGSGNRFRPDEPITRADVMIMVNRMLDRVPDAEHLLPDMKVWSDNPVGTRYYEAVQEATNEHAYERDDELGIVEIWTELLESRDWEALEDEWAMTGGSAAPADEADEAE